MKLKLSMLFVFISVYSWSQTIKTFTTNGSFIVPSGISSIYVQAWGGGGSGGGASGAGLLFGRGAAGGGGGAYAGSTLAVTSGAVLNVIVAGQTSGTSGANGKAGGNSTITGYESLLLASGGSGGAANNAGGNPIGGNGGSVAASAGSTKFAGVDGANGCSWSLLSLLLSSGAGGSGANFGGTGGAAVESLILGTAPGNAGSSPGGGGSGAINSALGTAQAGGTGAAGKVIISYTCPTYNITNVTAANICASAGSTSTITLSSSPPSLPVGNYVVTYNRSNPSAVALTANLVVSTAGTGTFTAVGLTAVGSSTITITKLTSDSCSSNIITNNTATITISPTTVGGTVNGGTTIDTGGASSLLTLSGHTGSVIKWQSAVNPFSVWTDIANTNTTYTSEALTETTQFRAVVQSGNCASSNSAPTTVTVNFPPTIALASSAVPFCSTNTASQTTLSYSGTTGAPTMYSIIWNSSPTNNLVSVIDAVLPPSPITITVPAGTVSGTYTGTLTVKNANGIESSGSIFTITVLPATAGGTVSGGSTINPGNTSGLLTLSDHSGSVIKWQSAISSFSVWTDIANTNTTYTSGSLEETTRFRAVVQNGSCAVVNSEPTTVEVNERPSMTLVATSFAVCLNSGTLSKRLDPSQSVGNLVNYSITWNAPASSGLVTVTDAGFIYEGAPIFVNFSANSIPGTYIGTLTVKDANGAVSLPINFTFIINAAPTINTTGTIAPVCISTALQNVTLAYSGVTGNPTSYSIDWNSAANAALLTDQSNASFTFSSGGGTIDTIVIPANVRAGTYSGTLNLFNGNCNGAQSISITVLPTTVGGTVSGGTTINPGSTSGLLTLSGHTGSVIKWQSAISPFSAWTDIANTNTTYTSVPLEETTQFRAVVQSGNCAVVNSATTTVTVNIRPTIVLAPSTERRCRNARGLPITTTLVYTGTTENPTTYSIVWNSSPANNFAAVTNAPLPASPLSIVIPAGAAAGIYSGTLTVKNTKSTVSSPGSTFSVIVDELPMINIDSGSINTVDGSTSPQNTIIEYSGGIADPTSYSIDWDTESNNALLEDQPSTPFTFSPNGGIIDIKIPANAKPGLHFAFISFDNGLCTQSRPIGLTIRNPLSITFKDPNPSRDICFNDGLAYGQAFVIDKLIGTGRITYSLVWDSSPANNLASVIDAALPQDTIYYDFIPGTLPIGTYTARLTIKDEHRTEKLGLVYTLNVTSCNQSPERSTPTSNSIQTAVLASSKEIVKTEDLESAEKNTVVTVFNQVISIESIEQKINQVFIYDISGNLLYKKDKVLDSKLIINNLRSSNQVLVVKILLDNNRIATKKVIY